MTWAIDRVKLVCRKMAMERALVFTVFFGTEIFKFILHTSRDKSFSKKKIGAIPHEFQKMFFAPKTSR